MTGYGFLAARSTGTAAREPGARATLEMAFRIARVFRVPLDEAFGYPDEQR